MSKKGVPKCLWDYGLIWASEINNRTTRGPDARTPQEVITGDTPDISEWLDFDFFIGVGSGMARPTNLRRTELNWAASWVWPIGWGVTSAIGY